MKDVVLYGNLTYDKVFFNRGSYNTVGGIANIWESLRSFDSSISVGVQPCAIGEAIILVDEDTCERASKPNLIVRSLPDVSVPAKWHHIAYLNSINHKVKKTIKFVEELSSIGGIVSADICDSQPIPFECLDKIDVLFAGEGDFIGDPQKIANKVKNVFIYHSPIKTIVYFRGDKVANLEVEEFVNNINVLGAGDKFAAKIIGHIVKYNGFKLDIDTIVKSITEAQLNLSKEFKEQK